MPKFEKIHAQRKAAIRKRRIIVGVVTGAVLLLVLISYLGDDEIISSGTIPFPIYDEEELITTDSGLQYVDLSVGAGPLSEEGDEVSTQYTGWLTDGTQFDSSVERGQPFPVTIGVSSVIAGWTEGLQGMQVGTRRILVIPSDLGYGVGGGGGGTIPPDATLIFEVEILEIN